MVAAMGMLVVIVSTSVPLLICGWIIVGLGLAVGVPQVFTAAGNVSARGAGRDLSRVVGVGYLAIMAGPSITGWLIELVSWTGAFLVPMVALLVCALTASVVGASAQPRTKMPIIDTQQQRGCA
jgi:MFS family permease